MFPWIAINTVADITRRNSELNSEVAKLKQQLAFSRNETREKAMDVFHKQVEIGRLKVTLTAAEREIENLKPHLCKPVQPCMNYCCPNCIAHKESGVTIDYDYARKCVRCRTVFTGCCSGCGSRGNKL